MADIRMETEAFQLASLENRRTLLTERELTMLDKITGQLIQHHGKLTPEKVLELIDLCDRTIASRKVRANNGDINIGDRVVTHVFVCGRAIPMSRGRVVSMGSDRASATVNIADGCGGAAWNVVYPTSHLSKEEADNG